MNINRADLIAVLSAIAAGASIALSLDLGPTIDALAPGYGKQVLAAITLVSIIAATLSRVLTNPSPPVGTVAALIPPGSIPVVTTAPGTGVVSVAHVNPATILTVTRATDAPPPIVTKGLIS